MKIFFYILILSISCFSLTLTSCKKGENDPFLSLRTRKARLSGQWFVSKSFSKEINAFAGGSLTTIINDYDGSTNVYSETNSSFPTSNVLQIENLTQEFTINRDGSYLIEIINSTNQIKFEETGVWVFAKKDKKSEYKNKEVVIFYPQKTVESNLTDNTSIIKEITNLNPGTTYIIDQLKNKEIVFVNESFYTNHYVGINIVSDSDGSYNSTIVLTKK